MAQGPIDIGTQNCFTTSRRVVNSLAWQLAHLDRQAGVEERVLVHAVFRIVARIAEHAREAFPPGPRRLHEGLVARGTGLRRAGELIIHRQLRVVSRRG
jgi:hypothetical protein